MDSASTAINDVFFLPAEIPRIKIMLDTNSGLVRKNQTVVENLLDGQTKYLHAPVTLQLEITLTIILDLVITPVIILARDRIPLPLIHETVDTLDQPTPLDPEVILGPLLSTRKGS